MLYRHIRRNHERFDGIRLTRIMFSGTDRKNSTGRCCQPLKVGKAVILLKPAALLTDNASCNMGVCKNTMKTMVLAKMGLT